MIGERDMVMQLPGVSFVADKLITFVPNVVKSIRVAGAGHWIQQERAKEVNEALIAFIKGQPLDK